MDYIAFDSHKYYTLASVETDQGERIAETRVPHQRGELERFLKGFEKGSPVAVEAVGNWYWIVEEIEAAGMEPRLVNPRKAKGLIANENKTDELDARGINRLQRNGTLPTVWIPGNELRDQRELLRTRMVLVKRRTGLKNRLLATFAKYALGQTGYQDAFGKKGRLELEKQTERLPIETKFAVGLLYEDLNGVEKRIKGLEHRIQEVLKATPEIDLLRTIPGMGFILAALVALEVGDVERFADSSRLASYSGTTPRLHSSGGKFRNGTLRKEVNHYLKWAFVEAANVNCINKSRHPERHVSRIYNRIKSRRGHAKAIGAVARHLAEAVYWVLKKKEPYRDPASQAVLHSGG